MADTATFFIRLLTQEDIEVWVADREYEPGDVVFASVNDIVTDQKFRCKQSPFGDFCTEYDPASVLGAYYWEPYKSGDPDLPPLSTEKVQCIPYSEHEEKQWLPGDKACIGEDNGYIWECREVSASDWCNIYPPESETGYLAWKLIDGVPDLFDPNASQDEEESGQKDLSDAEMLKLMADHPLEEGWTRYMRNLVLPLSVEQTWDCFFDDEAPFFIS